MPPMITVPASLATLLVFAMPVKIAVPLGTAAGAQLLFSTHSFGSPPLPPTQVAFWPRAVPALRPVPTTKAAAQARLARISNRRAFDMQPPDDMFLVAAT